MTYADFCIANLTANMPHYLGEDIMNGFPKLLDHCKRVQALPGVKEWIAKHAK